MKRHYLRLGLVLGIVAILSMSLAAAAGAQNTPDPQEGRPFLGVRLEQTSDGILIQAVLPDSPAAEASLQVNDLLTAINGTTVETARQAIRTLRGFNPGDTVTLDITRGDETLALEATLGSLRDARAEMGSAMADAIGVQYDQEDQTWTVSRLSETDALYAAGLREGDVVTMINGEPRDPRGLMELLQGADRTDSFALSVERDGETQEIEVPAPALMMLGMFGSMPGMAFPMMPGAMGPQGMGMLPMNGRLGVAFQMLTSELASDMEVAVTDGAVVREVAMDSPAASAGVQVDDIITAVNGEPVDAERTLRDRLIAYEPGDTVTLSVLRSGELLDIEVTLGEPMGPRRLGQFEGQFPNHLGEQRRGASL